MKRRDYHLLTRDVRRLRPLVAIVLTILILLPSFDEMVTQSLSPLTVLVRMAETLAFAIILVWLVSAVVLHYARVQAQSRGTREQEGSTHA